MLVEKNYNVHRFCTWTGNTEIEVTWCLFWLLQSKLKAAQKCREHQDAQHHYAQACPKLFFPGCSSKDIIHIHHWEGKREYYFWIYVSHRPLLFNSAKYQHQMAAAGTNLTLGHLTVQKVMNPYQEQVRNTSISSSKYFTTLQCGWKTPRQG